MKAMAYTGVGLLAKSVVRFFIRFSLSTALNNVPCK